MTRASSRSILPRPDTFTTILDDIEQNGDQALRDYSARFDNWGPPAFRLDENQIEACLRKLSARDLDDIRFAQKQVRNFAEAQRRSLSDVEVDVVAP